jgi:hypothetical protein
MALSWTLDGVEYDLENGELCYHQGNAGFGMAPFHRLEERGPLQHGVTDRGYRLDARTIQLALALFAHTREDLYIKRNQILAIFQPLEVAGTLKSTEGTRVRCIDCYAQGGGLAFLTSDRKGFWQKAAVILKADDPTWYNPDGKAVTFSLSGGGSGTPVPTPVPTSVGASTINESYTIDYSGTAPSFPHLIRFTGPITDPVLINNSTGDKLDFTGTTIVDGDYYDIDLRFDKKTVVNAAGVNKEHLLSDDSSITTWNIERAPVAPGGQNSITATGSGANANTKIDISYYERDSGV